MTFLKLDTDRRGIATLTLARAEKRNALSSKMIAELTKVATDLGQDDAVRVVVLAAEGDIFCAGGDLEWMRDQMAADAETRRSEAQGLATLLGTLNALPKPVIAKVQGSAFGGGLGLLSVADAVIAVETARFGLTETRLGLVPATIGPYVIAKLGTGRARRMFYSPRLIDAREAFEIGLVSSVVSEADLDEAIEAEAVPYLSASPMAVAASKRLLLRLGGALDQASIDASIDALIAQWESAEAVEGTAAFFEKRAPSWAQK